MDQVLQHVYGLSRFGTKLGLETSQRLLKELGNPQDSFKSVHIAGTNGKGSVVAFLSTALQEAGFKTGRYTSPHLVRFNERITVNGKEITDQEMAKLSREIIQAAKTLNIEPTFFEFTTALAFLHFSKQKVDYAVVEVGLGGRLDATNTLNPELSVITNISFDHEEHLGETEIKIAGEKAGIIKTHVPVLTGETDSEILTLFNSISQARSTVLTPIPYNYNIITASLSGQTFTYKSQEFSISLLGEHQIQNAILAIEACRFLKIPENKIQSGLEKTNWPARLEILSQKPLVILDSAHNIAGMEALAKFFSQIPNRKTLVIGFSGKRDYKTMLGIIAPLFENIIITKGNYKPIDPDEIKNSLQSENVFSIPGLSKALEKALELTGTGTLLVAGSIYMVGDALATGILQRKNL